MRLLRSVRDGEPSKQFGGQQGGRSFWSERDARSFHVLRERRTTVRADKHAYQTMLITSRHTQARRDLQQSLEFGDAQAQSQHLHATASAAFNERFQHTRRAWSPPPPRCSLAIHNNAECMDSHSTETFLFPYTERLQQLFKQLSALSELQARHDDSLSHLSVVD